jgi:hypothetical protein
MGVCPECCCGFEFPDRLQAGEGGCSGGEQAACLPAPVGKADVAAGDGGLGRMEANAGSSR